MPETPFAFLEFLVGSFTIDGDGYLVGYGRQHLQVVFIVSKFIVVTLNGHYPDDLILDYEGNSHPYLGDCSPDAIALSPLAEFFFSQQDRFAYRNDQSRQGGINVKIGDGFELLADLVYVVGKIEGTLFQIDDGDEKVGDIDYIGQGTVDKAVKLVDIGGCIGRNCDIEHRLVCFPGVAE